MKPAGAGRAGRFFPWMSEKGLKLVKGEVLSFASSGHMNRFSCARCGAGLYREAVPEGRYYAVMQAFEDPGAFDFTLEIFMDEKPRNYAFFGERTRLSADEFLAMLDESE